MAHKISKILLPIDGSEYSMRAVDYAIVEAKKEEDVELFAIHVVFVRQDYSLDFLAELGGGHVTVPKFQRRSRRRFRDGLI